VAESLGLCDLGDPVFDHPGFVGVSEVVEVHAGDDGSDDLAGIAVGGGPPAAAAEVTVADARRWLRSLTQVLIIIRVMALSGLSPKRGGMWILGP
jgi:hypothetical protein